MSDDPLDTPAAQGWLRTRREAVVREGFARRVAAAAGARSRSEPRGRPRAPWLRIAALTAGAAWFALRLAGLFLVFATS